MMFPEVEIEETTSTTSGTNDPLFDFEKKEIVFKDGKVVMCTNEQLIQQWIKLLILTEYEKYNVYKNTDFGLKTLYSLKGHQFLTSPYGISEIKREIEEKLEEHDKIDSVESISVTNSFDTLKIELTVIWDGTVIESEVNV